MQYKILAAALLLGASTANAAVTFTTGLGNPDPGLGINETLIDDFEGATAPAGITYSGSYTIDALNVSGFRAPPAGDATNYFATPGTSASLPGIATIDFGGYIDANRPFHSLSFYWGSIDSYNTLEVLDRDGNVLRTIFGNDVNNPADGNQTASVSNRRIYLRFSDTDNFGALRLTSTQRAFEIDDIGASTVPEPTTWAMLLTGLGLVGFASRRRAAALRVSN